MNPSTYNFASHYKGDTFNAVTFTIKEDGVPLSLTDAEIKIEFKNKSIVGEIQDTLTIGSGITFVDSGNGVFKIDSFINNWEKGVYFYDAEITFPDGVVRTYFKGSLKVNQDTSNG
jgi:hypothetical protein